MSDARCMCCYVYYCSAADLYITRTFKKCDIPVLRVYSHNRAVKDIDDEFVRRFCLINEYKGCYTYRLPKIEEINKYKIVLDQN